MTTEHQNCSFLFHRNPQIDVDRDDLQEWHPSVLRVFKFPIDSHRGLHTMPSCVCNEAPETYHNFFPEENFH